MTAVTHTSAPSGEPPRPAAYHSTEIAFPLWKLWVVLAVSLFAIKLPALVEFKAQDPHDYMRLLQVRDWLAGQGWFDTRQYRMNPPLGADIHWVRLGDLPLAAMLYPLQFVLPQRAAELTAMSLVPFLQLLLAMALLRELMRDLAMDRMAQLAGLLMLPIFPMLLPTFLPLRIDYHGWQGLCAMAMAVLLVRGGAGRIVAAGAVAATWLTLSLEGLPFVIACGGWLASRYWLDGTREHESYFLGLAAASVMLTVIFRPLADFPVPYCDVLSAPHLGAFAATAGLILATRVIPRLDSRRKRLAALLPVPIAAGLAIYLPLGTCAYSPLVNVDPLAREVFFDVFLEASSIVRQQVSHQVMAAATVLLILAGGALIISEAGDPLIRRRRVFYFVMAAVGAAVSLLVVRSGVVAQMLAVPACAALLQRYLPHARAIPATPPRILATLACLSLVTPIVPTALARPLDSPQPFEEAAEPYRVSEEECEYEPLNQLPPSQLFTPIAVTPYLLAMTPHTTVAGTYHRNDREIRDVILAFSGPVRESRSILDRYRTDYLVVCLSDIEVPYLASRGDGGLARQILRGTPPAWLQPVRGLQTETLRVYELK